MDAADLAQPKNPKEAAMEAMMRAAAIAAATEQSLGNIPTQADFYTHFDASEDGDGDAPNPEED